MSTNDFKNPVEFNSKYVKLIIVLVGSGLILSFFNGFDIGYSDLTKSHVYYSNYQILELAYIYFPLYLVLHAKGFHLLNIFVNILWIIFLWAGLFYNYGGFISKSGSFTFWFYPFLLIFI